jgi:N6-L-threonylcarbamoyladenine synthase
VRDSIASKTNCPLQVLAIESSCDESAVAVLDERRGLLAHQLFSQVDLHRVYGGVVPELASRDHTRRLLPLARAALAQAGTDLAQLSAVAYTAGPGLIGALLTGAAVGHSLAYALGVPAIPVHHLEGHLLAPLLEAQAPPFPHLALLVSGGHTMLIVVRSPGEYQILGQTLDDAAGEAFDKSAKLLGLPYPGGPELSRLAVQGDATAVALPRPLRDRAGFDFSFSGLKTAVMLAARAAPLTDARRADIAASAQQAIVDTLVGRTLRALEETGLSDLVVAGGVGANRLLRQRLDAEAAAHGLRLYFPRLEFCTDNAAMIAVAGLLRLKRGDAASGLAIQARAQWSLESLAAIEARNEPTNTQTVPATTSTSD